LSWHIEPLDSRHDAATFKCGKHPLDLYLKKYALENQTNDLGRTFVGVSGDKAKICGYYTLSSSKIAKDLLPETERALLKVRYPVPVILLGRLAVDVVWRGKGLGKILLMDAIKHAERLASSELGVRGVELDAMDDEAKAFYLHFGFKPLQDDPRHLYLGMKDIRQLKLR
jgi:GNAT superfamily N-acetyltransferase